MASVNYQALGDGELVTLSREDDEAFGELARRWSGKLLRVAGQLLGSPEDARDAVQEALLLGWAKRDRYLGTGSFYAWLRKVLLNVCLARLRRPALPRVSFEGLAGEEGPPLELPDLRDNPETVVERRLTDQEIRAAFARLPAHYRLPLYLAVHESLTYEQIASRLGIPVGTVKSRINMARRMIRGAVRRD